MSKVIADPDIDMILIVVGNADRGAEALVQGMHGAFLATDKPFAVAWSDDFHHTNPAHRQPDWRERRLQR